MTRQGRIISFESVPYETVTVGDTKVTPLARSFVVRLPFAVFSWQRPQAVMVERAGQVERIPVYDVMRLAQVTLFGLGLAALLVGRAQSRRRKESSR